MVDANIVLESFRWCQLATVGPQDTQLEEVQTHFAQYGPVAACQMACNNSTLIALVQRQSKQQVNLILAYVTTSCLSDGTPLLRPVCPGPATQQAAGDFYLAVYPPAAASCRSPLSCLTLPVSCQSNCTHQLFTPA